MRKRRWVDISIVILESAKTPKTKTRLMYRSNLNFARFNAYFNDFLRKELLEEKNVGGNETYVISEKGKILLAALKKAEKLFSQGLK